MNCKAISENAFLFVDVRGNWIKALDFIMGSPEVGEKWDEFTSSRDILRYGTVN